MELEYLCIACPTGLGNTFFLAPLAPERPLESRSIIKSEGGANITFEEQKFMKEENTLAWADTSGR
ncbi:hypothetical protein ACTXT7_009211 [Hymenolepis weldensis]